MKGDRKGDGLREKPYFVPSTVLGTFRLLYQNGRRRHDSDLIAGSRSTIAVRFCREPLHCVVDPQLQRLMSRASFQKPRDNAKGWGRSLPRWSGGWVRSSGDGQLT